MLPDIKHDTQTQKREKLPTLDMTITVLRLGHRSQRDKRLSTHLILCARALGADKVIYSGEEDPRLEAGIKDIVERWGGDFSIEYEFNWRKIVKNWTGTIIHLTMYGLPVEETAPIIRDSYEHLLVIVVVRYVPVMEA